MRAKRMRVTRALAIIAALATCLGIALTSIRPATAEPVLPEAPGHVRVSQRPTMAALSWDAVDGAAGYVIAYDTDAAFTDPVELTTTATILLVPELAPLTTYFLRAAASNSLGEHGEWSEATSFATPARPYPVLAPAAELSSPSTTSIEATWQRTNKAWSYEAAVGTSAQELDTTTVVKAKRATFSDLDAKATYYFSLRVLSGEGEPISDWSQPVKYEIPQSLPLRVGSYNVKCENCRKKGEKSWAQRKSAVVSTINSQNLDVLGIQEASQGQLPGRSTSQFDDLLNGLGGTWAITNDYRYNCANSRSYRHCRYVNRGASLDTKIFYNTKTVTLIRQGSVKLPTQKGANQARYLAWAVFRQKSTGRLFLFGNTHLEPKGFFALRARQTQAIVNALNRLNPGKKMPTMMVGDFNAHKWDHDGNRPYRLMLGAGYIDPLGNSYRSRGSTSGAIVEKRIRTNYSSYNGFSRKAPRFGYVNGTYIDYIFVTRMRVSEWETVVRIDSAGRFIGTIPSDHNLIRATVWLP